MDRQTFDVLMLIATWLSAIGTVGAVIAALWLATVQNRRTLRVTAHVARLVGMYQSYRDAPESVIVSAVNTGFRDVILNTFSWHVGWTKRPGYLQIPPANPYSHVLPYALHPGDTAQFVFPAAEYLAETKEIQHDLRRRTWFTRRLRVGFHTTTAESVYARVDKTLIDLLVNRKRSPQHAASAT